MRKSVINKIKRCVSTLLTVTALAIGGCMTHENVETFVKGPVELVGFLDAHGQVQYKGLFVDYTNIAHEMPLVGIEIDDGSIVALSDVSVEWLETAVAAGLASRVVGNPEDPSDDRFVRYRLGDWTYVFMTDRESIISMVMSPPPWGTANTYGVLWNVSTSQRYVLPISRGDAELLFGAADRLERSSFHMK